MSVKLLVNQEHNGLELYFPDKPEEHVLDALKSAHWRYHRVKKCWYARHTEANHKLALQFAGNELAAADAKNYVSTTCLLYTSFCDKCKNSGKMPLLLWAAFPVQVKGVRPVSYTHL